MAEKKRRANAGNKILHHVIIKEVPSKMTDLFLQWDQQTPQWTDFKSGEMNALMWLTLCPDNKKKSGEIF